MEDSQLYTTEEDTRKCRKHIFPAYTGVCPLCLRDRLLLLCPNCAQICPCECSDSTIPVVDGRFWRSRSTGVSLSRIENEAQLGRSKSMAVGRRIHGEFDSEKKSWASFGWKWPFRSRKKRRDVEERPTLRWPWPSGGGPDLRWKGYWNWNFPNPMRAFGHGSRGSRARVVNKSFGSARINRY